MVSDKIVCVELYPTLVYANYFAFICPGKTISKDSIIISHHEYNRLIGFAKV